MNPKKTLYNVVCNVQWCLSFLLSIEFLFPLQENDSSPNEGLWLKTNHIVWPWEISFYTMIARFIAHKTLVIITLLIALKNPFSTLVSAHQTPYNDTCDCIQNPTTPHLWLHIKTLPLDTLYQELLLFLHSRTQDLHPQSVGEQVVQGIGNNNVW